MILSDLIKSAAKHGSIVIAYVYGNLGTGKTSYALWTAYEVLGSWREALRHLFFRPEEALQAMYRALSRDERIPLIIMDDAGTWLGRLTWWEEHKVAFMNFFNLIRSVAHGVIFTTPTEELPRQVLRKASVRVHVRWASREELEERSDLDHLRRVAEAHGVEPVFSVAEGYVVRTLPSFMQVVRKDYYDVFPTHYPAQVFEKYERMRHEAVRALLNEWASSLRREAVEKAREMLASGQPRAAAMRYLVSKGIPRTTAFRIVRRLIQKEPQKEPQKEVEKEVVAQ